MRTSLILAVLALPLLTEAQNLVMNGKFNMGTVGYAQQRALRFDTNPKQHFIPFEMVKLPDVGRALKMSSPYSESSTISTRQFPLKNNTKYTMRVKMRSNVPVATSVSVYSIANKWRMFNAHYTVGSEWKEYVYHFTTSDKDGNGFFYHIDVTAKNLNGEIFIRDLELFETASNAENGLQFAADVKEPVLETTEKTLKWNVPVYAWNGTKKTFKGTVSVTAQEQFFPEKSYKVEIPVELAPSESKVFMVNFTTDYGCYEITEKCSEASRCIPAYQGVIGKYTAKKLDFDKDFSIGVVGGLNIFKTGQTLATRCWSDPGNFLEFLSKMGCRMFRELGTGIESTSWALMEPEEGKWDFSYLDYRLDLFEKYKIEPVPCVGAAYCFGHASWQPVGFPMWVRNASIPVKPAEYNWEQVKNRKTPPAVPPLNKWRIYAHKLTAHAKGRIKYYEIFNEPNGYLPAENYFPYLKAFYEEAKKNDTDCRIVGLCVTSDLGAVGDKFTTDMMKFGAGKYMDIASFHPYSGRELNSFLPADDYIANFRKNLGPEYEKTMPIWNTELFFLYDNDPAIPHSEEDVNPARATARVMVDLGEGIRQAQQLTPMHLIQRQLIPEGRWDIASIRELLPNSTYVAFNTMARFLEAAKPVAKFKLDSGVIAYIYRKDDKLLAGLWNYQHKKHVNADLCMFELYDVYGNEVPSKKNMSVTDTPLYLKPGKLSDEAFIDAVKNLKIGREIPVEAQPHARVVEFGDKKTLYVTLVNETDKNQFGCTGFSGNGLTAIKRVNFEIPAKARKVIAIPLREAASITKAPELLLSINNTLFRFKLKLHKGLMISAGTSVKLEKEDFNGTWSMARKGSDVVLNIKVADKTDSGEPAERKMWQQDCIELFFDNAPLELIGMGGERYTPATFRLFVMPRLDKGKQLIAWIAPNSQFKKTDFKHSVKVSPDGYEVEVTIPSKKVSSIIGFDIKVSDALPREKAHRSIQWTTRKKNNIFRTVFNLIKL